MCVFIFFFYMVAESPKYICYTNGKKLYTLFSVQPLKPPVSASPKQTNFKKPMGARWGRVRSAQNCGQGSVALY